MKSIKWILVFIVVIIILFPVSCFTLELTPLKQLKNTEYLKPEDFVKYYSFEEFHENIPTIGNNSIIIFWHFIDTGKTGLTATIEFVDQNYQKYIVVLNPYKLNMHYGVYTPSTFMIDEAWLNGKSTGNFNLSHVSIEKHTTQTTDPMYTTNITTTGQTTKATTRQTSQTTISQSRETTTGQTTGQTTGTTTRQTTGTTTRQSSESTLATGTSNYTSTNTRTISTTTFQKDIPSTGESEEFRYYIGFVLIALSTLCFALKFVLRKSLK